MRTQIMVLSFYLVDVLFMVAFAEHGLLPALAPVVYGAAGCGLTGLFAVVVRMGLHRRMGGARFTTVQLVTACSLMLVTAAVVPQIGMLLLLTMMVAVATAALQLPLKHVLAVSGLVATCSLALLMAHGDRFGMPLEDRWSRLLSGLWFAVVLGKIAAINLIGVEMRKALSASNARLALALTQVRELSERDELTGLKNRRSILALLTEEGARFARGGQAFGLALLDIDHFKRVNDRLGHAAGDDVLRVFAKIVTGNLRGTDHFARYGGEEFLLLLPNTLDAPAAVLAAERLRRVVDEHPWTDLAADLKVTCSIGVTVSHAGEGVAEMLERADAALYRAKSDGRNIVCAE
ncbi:MAG: GGDEF domain-containing protein [Rubrivivax sp.]|nr:GGDEF domain-containing protein [Rubrivivax sp.]